MPEIAVPCARQPVVILGMHRSGTSMISELLDRLGLFVGRELQDDHESTWFLDVNDQMMHRVGCSWDRPTGFVDFLASEDAVDMTARAVAADVTSGPFRRFLGTGRWSGTTVANFDKPWGWKDPRTVFTLPVWLKVFPSAKLVYIVRHGVDVAKSLVVREQKLLKLRRDRFDDRLNRRSSRPALDRAGYKGSPRCLTLGGGFDLWTEYVRRGDANLAAVTNATYTLKYEDVLAQPQTHLPPLAAFCGLSPSAEALEAAIRTIDSSRATAFKTDPTTAAFYESIRSDPWMTKYGY